VQEKDKKEVFCSNFQHYSKDVCSVDIFVVMHFFLYVLACFKLRTNLKTMLRQVRLMLSALLWFMSIFLEAPPPYHHLR